MRSATLLWLCKSISAYICLNSLQKAQEQIKSVPLEQGMMESDKVINLQ